MKNSVCNESGIVPPQAFTVAIVNIPVLTEDIFSSFFWGVFSNHLAVSQHMHSCLLTAVEPSDLFSKKFI